MLLNLETIDICIYMLKNVEYAKICKINLHIWNRINIILEYNSDCAKKICQVINIRALVIIVPYYYSIICKDYVKKKPVYEKPYSSIDYTTGP
jgi:hypothetical protein